MAKRVEAGTATDAPRPRTVGSDTLISVVAPVFNEGSAIDTFVEEIIATTEKLNFPGRFEIVLVNDGSSDGSDAALDGWTEREPDLVRVVHLARNFGHDAAVSAGLQHAHGDAVILLDSDMQDDPAAFGPFIERWLEGYDVVYATRVRRKENPILRFFFWAFYRLLGLMANFRLPMHAGNFSMMDRQVVKHLLSMGERNRYLPGLRAWVGFHQIGVPVERRARHDKKARVGFRAKWTLAMNAFFSFSYAPIFAFRGFGMIAILLSIFLFLIALIAGIAQGTVWANLSAPLIWIAFFAGINLFGISVVGEYVARIYDEVKNRPRYIVDRVTGGDDEKDTTAASDQS